MMQEKDWLWLCSIPGLYRKQQMLLLHYFGSVEEIINAPQGEWDSWKKLGAEWTGYIRPVLEKGYEKHLEQVQRTMEKYQVRFVSCEHPEYPEKLRMITDYPYGLFFRGGLPDDAPAAAVVGARACSTYGASCAALIGKSLARMHITVISGMAAGIDGIAQKAALMEGGRSYAVLGSGPERCYPAENIELYEMLREQGGLLSEYPCLVPGRRSHYPMRNRIISGLADVVIVVEARMRSGSLITADLAAEQGRDVYAVPGRVRDSLSEGCNHLIRQGAAIFLSPEELAEDLEERFPEYFERKGRKKAAVKKKQVALAPDEELLYSYLDLLPSGLERLRSSTGLSGERLMKALLNLQLMDLAAEIGKNQYVRTS